ncbi:MAG: hydrogenase accessory protein HypB [Calditrichaeota bacterium]|nr:MAG: hydrogenase accessory protein HypB [Calditrichota bacterium]
MSKTIEMQKKVLSENDRLAADLRRALQDKGIFSMNFVSSPGSGKTSLLERTLQQLRDTWRIALIAGDVQTENDAQRLIAAGGQQVKPLVTGGSCHLDARMIERVIPEIDLDETDMLIVENVGNLVCPAGYDLGEDMKVVLISVTEGDDKPLKYPAMFRRSSVMVINKIDILEWCDFDLETVKKNALQINGDLTIFEVSCRTGEGLDKWYDWLGQQVRKKKAALNPS